jgi:hypothetical protein
MIVTAWNNGSYTTSGAGYGVKLDASDRDRFFKREWKTIELELEGSSVVVPVNISKDSFWNTSCRELISAEIGRWLIRNNLAPWAKGSPPKLTLEHKSNNRFLLRK